MKFAELTIKLRAKENIKLSSDKGSVIRGAFGFAFRKVCCPFPSKDSQECLLQNRCVYSYIFETPRPAHSKIMRLYEKA